LVACVPEVDDDDSPPVDPPEPSAPGAMSIAILPAEPSSTEDFLVEVTSPAEDSDDDLEGVHYRWFVDDVERTKLADTAAISHDLTSRGETWRVVAVPFDAVGLEGPETEASVLIGNSPPGAPGVAVGPENPVGGVDTLLCTVIVDAQDPDGDAVSYSLSWLLDGEAYPAKGHAGPSTAVLEGDTVPAEDTAPGQEWMCQVTPADDLAPGEPGDASVFTESPPPLADFSLADVNETSPSFGQPVSPRDYLERVSGWYFGHAT
jgi:hypothetical protein